MKALNSNEMLTLGIAALALIVSLWSAWEAHKATRVAASELEHALTNERLQENAGWLQLKSKSWQLVDFCNRILFFAGRMSGNETTPEKTITASDRESWIASSKQILEGQLNNPALKRSELAFHNWRLIEEDLRTAEANEEASILVSDDKGNRPARDEDEIQVLRSRFFVTLVRKIRDEALQIFMETVREAEQAGGFGPYKGSSAFPWKNEAPPVKK
jgi:hypothetical protein